MTIKRKQEDSKSHFHTRHQEIGGGQHSAAPLTTDPCTYVYNFADGSSTTLVFNSDGISDINSSWLSELQELDRQEYNNNHTQTRRHCSLEAQDPEEWVDITRATICSVCSLVSKWTNFFLLCQGI